MLSSKKEFIFLVLLLAVSSSSFMMQYDGFRANPVEPNLAKNVFEFNSHNCYEDIKDNDKAVAFSLHKGHFFSEPLSSSIYYSISNINAIPTSTKWKIPFKEKCNSQLKIFESAENEKQYFTKLFIPENERSCTQGLPLISIVVNTNDFFDDQKGIYVRGNAFNFGTGDYFYTKPWTEKANYFERGKQAERNATFTYYDEHGDSQYASGAKVSIAGNATRSFPQKSLCIEAIKQKGPDVFEYDFFGDSTFYSSIILRNGGNDWTKTLVSDGIMQELMQSTGLQTLNFKPSIVFINGVYWGIHSIRNQSNEKLISTRFHVKRKDVTLLENWNLNYGDQKEVDELMNVIKKCNKKSNETTLSKLYSLIDIDDFVLYLSAQIFFANTDWGTNNIKAYKIKNKEIESKWRFIFFDLDYGMGYTGTKAVESDMFDFIIHQKGYMGSLIAFLMTSNNFKEKLKLKLVDLMNRELSVGNIHNTINKYHNLLKTAIKSHINRWRTPKSLNEWEKNIAILLEFSANRKKVIENQIQHYLKIK